MKAVWNQLNLQALLITLISAGEPTLLESLYTRDPSLCDIYFSFQLLRAGLSPLFRTLSSILSGSSSSPSAEVQARFLQASSIDGDNLRTDTLRISLAPRLDGFPPLIMLDVLP